MLFDGYEDFILEESIDLNQFLRDNETISGAQVVEEFFVEEKKSFINKVKKIFNTGERDLEKSLKESDVNFVLLVLPLSFIKTVHKHEKKMTKSRINLDTFRKTFFEAFSKRFKDNEIDCTIVSSNIRYSIGEELVNEWLDLKKLKSSLSLDKSNNAYLFGFKEFNVADSLSAQSIYLKHNNKEIELKENSTTYIGSSSLFKFKIQGKDSMCKIDNSDGYLEFTTQNIDKITSNDKDLNSDYFEDDDIEDFPIDVEIINSKGVVLEINKSLLELSSQPTLKTEPKNELEHEEYPSKDKEDLPLQEPLEVFKKDKPAYIETSDDSGLYTNNYINKKDKYIINLNSFFIPFDTNLERVEFYLVLNHNKYNLVASSQKDETLEAVAKVVVNVSSRSLEVVNLSDKRLQFALKRDYAEMKSFTEVVSKGVGVSTEIDTDEDNSASSKVELQKGESYLFKSRVEFKDCSVEVLSNGVKVEFANLPIKSFNKTGQISRNVFSLYRDGNIIDYVEKLEYGGRVYSDGSNRVIGSLISRNPIDIEMKKDGKMLISNEINEKYTVKVSASNFEKELEYNEAAHIDLDRLFSLKNKISIVKKGIELVSFSISAN